MTKAIESFMNRYNDIRKYFVSKTPLVYADSTLSDHLPAVKGSALIFPPSDYWAICVNLNAKNEKEAKKYGPALFELGEQYQYEAQKVEENKYVLIAYDPVLLQEKLLAYPHLEKITKITFAQWVFDKEVNAIRVNDKKYLTVVDNIVIEIDQRYLYKNTKIEVNDLLAYPRAFIRTLLLESLVVSEVTNKTLWKTWLILSVFLGNFSMLAYFSHQDSLRLEESMHKMIVSAKVPETSIERDAVLASLRLKEKKQLNLRHQCYKISSLPIEVKQPTATTTAASSPSAESLPPIPPILNSNDNLSANGIVLIPGSNPSEKNQLLVQKSSSAVNTMQQVGDGIQEITYDGHGINVIINTADANSKEKIKNELTKQFKNIHINDHNSQIEAHLK